MVDVGNRPKVLVIDDDETLLEIVKANLNAVGLSVLCAYDGEEGLEMARAAQPGVILLDRQMPGLDGNEVLETLKEEAVTKDIPVVMLTATNKADEIVGSLCLGAEDYIVKPFEMDDFRVRVKKALGLVESLSPVLSVVGDDSPEEREENAL
ncbi:MAG: response regulator [Rhodospirillales bacterium]|nr:response regulator [Alphaproteobacteria bacterium]USO04429.1 MAG: response regulator [Rhodospirillales bacterium]